MVSVGTGGTITGVSRRVVNEVDDILCVLPDGGEKYLATIYDDAWLAANGVVLDEPPQPNVVEVDAESKVDYDALAQLLCDEALAPSAARIRALLCAENFLIAFGVGAFLTLPLALKSRGLDEVFFGQVFAAGAIGALLCAGTSSWLLRRFGIAAIAPWGSGTFCVGSVVLAACMARPDAGLGWYLGSVLQGMGWGLFLTQGPICLSTIVSAKRRAYHFMIYGAFNTLGIGLAPLASRWAHDVAGWHFIDLFVAGSAASGVAWRLPAPRWH
ncbi:MAG: MFS transporter [Rhodoferax sp.]